MSSKHHIRIILSFLLIPLSAFAARPNILFILADDLGYGDLSCYGQTTFETPALDALATGGLRFTDHYSGATVCAPSRACLMTGKNTGHTAIRGNGPHNLPGSETTIASLLKQTGYRTALIGKSCVSGNTQSPGTLAEHGFSYFFGTTDHTDGHHRYPCFVYENMNRIDFPENQLHTGKQYDLDLYTAKTLDYLDQQSGGQPFFLLLSLPVPHASINLPDEAWAGEQRGHYTQVQEPKASYMALMRKIDDSVATVVNRLRARNLLDNTLVIFTSDNGSHSEGGYHPHMLRSSGPLRGHKRDLYEGGIRVPFIAHWPAVIQPGRTSSHPSTFWDFLPTVCDLVSIPVPSGIQGLSYLPTLRGDGKQAVHDSLYWEFHEKNGRRALRSGDWKIVQYDLARKPPGAFELYNLGNDLSEKTNLAEQHPEIVDKLRAKIESARVPCLLFPFPVLDLR